MIEAGEIIPSFALAEQSAAVLNSFRSIVTAEWMADACIVRMTELIPDCAVITVDRADFSVYRRHERNVIPLILPPEES
jgi:hypothetical protein